MGGWDGQFVQAKAEDGDEDVWRKGRKTREMTAGEGRQELSARRIV